MPSHYGSKRKKVVKASGKAVKALSGDAAKRERARRLRAKRKASKEPIDAKAAQRHEKELEQIKRNRMKLKKEHEGKKAAKAAAAGGGKKPPNGNGKKVGAAAPKKTPKKKAARGEPIYSAGNLAAYKEAIMIKEGLNTWPSTRDPFPKSAAEFKVWDRVGSYRKK